MSSHNLRKIHDLFKDLYCWVQINKIDWTQFDFQKKIRLSFVFELYTSAHNTIIFCIVCVLLHVIFDVVLLVLYVARLSRFQPYFTMFINAPMCDML